LIQDKRSDSLEPSCVSMKSDSSMNHPPLLRKKDRSSAPSLMQGTRLDPPDPSCVSMKSDTSMNHPPLLREGDLRYKKKTVESEIVTKNQLESVFKELENKVITLLKYELRRFMKLVSADYPACSEEVDEEDQSSVREGVLKITLQVLKDMNQTVLANTLQN
ncbi:NACHT, LRR and PYD domains-containing protein 12-like, partial [Clarias magur]